MTSAIDIACGNLLEDWSFLPHLSEIRDTRLCAELYRSYLENLVKQCAAADSDLLWSREHCPSGDWCGAVRLLDWDTKLFGFAIGRLEPLIAPASDSLAAESLRCGVSVVQQCLARARELELKHLSAAVDSRDSASQFCLQQAGFQMRDTIVTYQARLPLIRPESLDMYDIRKANENDIEPLAAISAECFGNRQYNINRFNSEPAFSPQLVQQLYADWLRNLFSSDLADQVLVADEKNQPVGFISVKLPTSMQLRAGLNVGRIPLNAVHPQFHRKGIYTRLVKAALNWMQQHGTESVQIGTQITVGAVPRAWQNLGTSMVSSYHTFHNLLA